MMEFDQHARVAQLALVACPEEHPVPTRPPLRRQSIFFEGQLAQLGNPGPTNAQIGSVLFAVAVLQSLDAAFTEHLRERPELH